MKRFYLVFMLLISFRLFADTTIINNNNIINGGSNNTINTKDSGKITITNVNISVGISLTVIGTLIASGGVAGFLVGSEKEQDKYESMMTEEAVHNAYTNNVDQAEYEYKANKHRDKSNTYKKLAIATGVVGGATAVTGIIQLALGISKRNKSENEKTSGSLSVTPINKGFYASLNLNF